MSNIFRVDLFENYTYVLFVRLCQDATSDVLNPLDIFEQIFSIRSNGKRRNFWNYRDIRWFVNFNKWEEGNGKRKWKSGKEFYGSRIFYSSIKVSYARQGKKKKVSWLRAKISKDFSPRAHILLRCLSLLARSFLPPFYIAL